MTVRLEQLLAAATPGPWRRYFLRERVVIDHAKFRVAEIHADPEGPRVYQDAALIALAPDMARLLIEWAGDDPERLARLDALAKEAADA